MSRKDQVDLETAIAHGRARNGSFKINRRDPDPERHFLLARIELDDATALPELADNS